MTSGPRLRTRPLFPGGHLRCTHLALFATQKKKIVKFILDFFLRFWRENIINKNRKYIFLSQAKHRHFVKKKSKKNRGNKWNGISVSVPLWWRVWNAISEWGIACSSLAPSAGLMLLASRVVDFVIWKFWLFN